MTAISTTAASTDTLSIADPDNTLADVHEDVHDSTAASPGSGDETGPVIWHVRDDPATRWYVVTQGLETGVFRGW
jgi:hypothetical protein